MGGIRKAVVYTKPKISILFLDQNNGTGLFGLTWLDYTSLQLLIYVLTKHVWNFAWHDRAVGRYGGLLISDRL